MLMGVWYIVYYFGKIYQLLFLTASLHLQGGHYQSTEKNKPINVHIILQLVPKVPNLSIITKYSCVISDLKIDDLPWDIS